MNKPVHVNDLFEIQTFGSCRNETKDSILTSRISRGHSPQKERRNFDRETDIQAQLTINGTSHKILDMSSTGLSIEKTTLSKTQNRTGIEIRGQIEYPKDGRWFAQKAIFIIASIPSEDVIRLQTVLLLGWPNRMFQHQDGGCEYEKGH